ncbi:MAG: zinc-ribbon domain-containing protein [Prevotella veroralis]
MAYCKNCGSPLNEGSEFCSQCGTPQHQDDNESYTEQSRKDKLFNVPKKAWRIIIPVAVLLLLCFTNPSKTKHVEAIHTELMKALEQQGGSEATVYASLGAGIIDKVLVSKLDVSNYFIFSVGSLQNGKKSKVVSFGILGHVFTSELDKDAFSDLKKKNKTLGL